ncbi:glycoside hydrolase family 2 protein [Anaerocellum diazotrophicum]|uniref:Beta-glucuronidase n=1 Tax=Caldicellulosiruptor diazotrophicus TaxID=2806205 RepID=A0ABM7NQ72_9FIRM|nr:glycoside hydrolase family 2 TIM barrel-domain containing protein [Caldicellulosiruptor diazotrophicus]BCS82248.1 beta-glucuronidase [Caldicellulosiruptor diazotrophicus]
MQSKNNKINLYYSEGKVKTMVRLFTQHKIRRQKELEGFWDFAILEDRENIFNKSFTHKMWVPGCWETYPEFSNYRGKALYKTIIECDNNTNLRLIFKGVSHTAEVYFDNIKVANHYNAYTQFDTIIKNVEKGKHELLVLVDNSFSNDSVLHIPNDYFTYGGIIRPVVMEEIEDIFIERLEFSPTWIKDNTWAAEISIYVRNVSSKEFTIKVKGNLDDYELDFGIWNVRENQLIKITKRFEFNDVKVWSSENPHLYLLNVRLWNEDDKCIDDLIERVGFREVKIKSNRIYLNGKPVFFKGFNRHEDHPDYGCALPLQIMVKDIMLIKQSGANMIRTSHYPNDERFLDLCDEFGIYVWEENHARGLTLQHMQNPNFDIQCENCNREMVLNHYNHPSIVIWGILNECASQTPEGREKYKKQIEQIKGMDKTRPITFASCMHFSDLCLDLVDIVSMNVYSGWYEDRDTNEFFDKLYSWIQQAGGAGKPIIISEFGAEGLYGFRDPFSRVKWSEERQADILEDNLIVYLNREEISGALIWQFCDCKVTEEGKVFLGRARTKNNKGVFDEYRRPKIAYDIVKRFFSQK